MALGSVVSIITGALILRHQLLVEQRSMSFISSRSVDCRQTSMMCAPFFTCQRAISLASSHFSSAISFLNRREPMTLVRSPTISGRLRSSASTSSMPE